jgi:hypothetical protein
VVLVCLEGEQKGVEGQIVKPLRKPRYGAEQLSTSAIYLYNASRLARATEHVEPGYEHAPFLEIKSQAVTQNRKRFCVGV